MELGIEFNGLIDEKRGKEIGKRKSKERIGQFIFLKNGIVCRKERPVQAANQNGEGKKIACNLGRWLHRAVLTKICFLAQRRWPPLRRLSPDRPR